MLLNESTALVSERLVLRPYRCVLSTGIFIRILMDLASRRSHVPRYHAWMSNETLREETASELLTLEEEFAMQGCSASSQFPNTTERLEKHRIVEGR